MIRPTGNRVLLKRLDGDGREERLASGLYVPVRDQSLRHGNAERVPDTFKAEVLAMSDGATKATQGALEVGDVVMVHTYEQTSQRTLTGDETPYGLLVDVDNVMAVLEGEAADMLGRTLTDTVLQSPLMREYLGAARADRIADELEKMPLLGAVEKTEEWRAWRGDDDSDENEPREVPREPASVRDLGFYRGRS